MRVIKSRRILLSVLAGGVFACSADKVASPDTASPGRPFFTGPAMTDTLLYDSFTGSDGTNIVAHVAETGQSWGLNGGFTNKIQIQGNAARLVSGADNNNWRMSVTTDVSDDTFDLSADYKRGSADVPGDYAQLEFLAQSGTNPPQDRVYVAFTRTSPTTVQARLIRTKAFSFAQSIILDSAFPLATDSSKRLGVSVSGLQVQTWWEPAGGGTRTNIGSAVTLTQDYRDGTHKRVAFNFVGAQASGPGSPRIDNFLALGPAVADTGRPPVPDSRLLPDDSANTLPSPFGTVERYYPDIVGVMFDDTTSGSTIQTILSEHQASIIAGGEAFPYPVYYLQMPDPGGTYWAIDSLARAIDDEAGVFSTYVPQWRSRIDIRYRHPNDGPSARRADWFSPTDATRALLAIRAPMAWGCENGTYSTSVPVGILDRQFEGHTDLVASIRSPVNRLKFLAMPTVDELEHGNRVAGIFGATGDNSTGIAGMMWSSELTLYAMGDSGLETSNVYDEFVHHLVHIVESGTRILSMSATFGTATDTANIRWIVEALRIYFQRGGMLVYAIGDDPQARPTLTELRHTTDSRYSGVDKAVAILRDSLGFSDNIITVSATGTNGAFLNTMTYWLGGTDILAPGEQILTLGVSNTTSLAPPGTSFATPYVTGVAALMLAMDPTLTAAQVKDSILRGARLPRWNTQTLQEEVPQPVAGVPSGESVYQLDAYGAVQLVARKAGTPLCGNRVWVTGNAVLAERDPITHTTESLVALNEVASYVNVRHGGRRIEVSTESGDRAYQLVQGQWVQTQDTATTPYGGSFLSLFHLSHDRDSSVSIEPNAGDGFVDLAISIRVGSSGPPATVHTIHVPLPSSGSYVCLAEGCTPGADDFSVLTSFTTADWRFAYSPQGDRIFVAITTIQDQMTGTSGFSPCPWADPGDPTPPTCRSAFFHRASQETKVHSISLPGGNDAILWTVPTQVFWLAGSEDGGQAVVAEGAMSQDYTIEPFYPPVGFRSNAQPQVVSGCSITYRLTTSSGPVRHTVASDDACSGLEGQGTISPAPPLGRRLP